MTNKISSLLFITIFLLLACNQKRNQDGLNTKQNQISIQNPNGVINKVFKDSNGTKLYLTFDNTKQLATLKYKGDTIVLKSKTSASGFLYTNAQYKLRGKGDSLQLTKDGVLIFEHSKAH